MGFDVPKVVRSPGCDHGHDEESRNGRDIKIDILDDYIRTPNGSEGYRIYTGVPGGYRNPPGGYWASWAQSGGRGEAAGGGAWPPLPQSELGKGRGRGPFSFLLSTSSFPLLLDGIGKGGKTYLE